MKEKKCSKCREIKQIKEFSKRKGSQDGYDYRCKTCVKIYKQSEKGKQSIRKYNQSDNARKVHKRYKNSEKGKRATRIYRQSDDGKKADKKRKQSKKGRQQIKKDDAIRKVRKTQAGGSYTIAKWYNLCKFYDFHCLRCDKKFPFEKLTLDHVKPVSKGGTSFIWNTQPLCNKCNSRKHNKEMDYRKILPDWINRDGPMWQQDNLF